MNQRIKELIEQAGFDPAALERMGVLPQSEKFAELLIQDTLCLLRQQWYDLNNLPAVQDESPRDIGLRVGKKSEIISLMAKIKKHYGLDDEIDHNSFR